MKASQVTFRYPGAARDAVAGVDLAAPSPGLTCLLGPNGSGKSTLLQLLGGLLRPDGGAVELDGHDPARMSRAAAARRWTFLPAGATLPPDHTAREVVVMARHPFGRGLLLERADDLARADAALARAGAAELAGRRAAELSSGERQRVLVARALCQDTPALLLDEPTSAQDLAHELDLFALFATLAREGRTVVVATHALNAAARHADRLVVLQEGRGVADGAPAEVLTSALLERVFEVRSIVGDDGGVPYAVPQRRRA